MRAVPDRARQSLEVGCKEVADPEKEKKHYNYEKSPAKMREHLLPASPGAGLGCRFKNVIEGHAQTAYGQKSPPSGRGSPPKQWTREPPPGRNNPGILVKLAPLPHFFGFPKPSRLVRIPWGQLPLLHTVKDKAPGADPEALFLSAPSLLPSPSYSPRPTALGERQPRPTVQVPGISTVAFSAKFQDLTALGQIRMAVAEL